MISSIKNCYSKYFSSNKYFYVGVINECDDYINMLLYYKINDKVVTKPSPVFGPGSVEHILFPDNASNIFLRIFNSSFNPPSLICSKSITNYKINRYKIIRNLDGNLDCIDIESY